MSYFKRLYYRLIGKTPDQMPMVKYWRTKDAVAAKITRAEDGSICMKMEGEDYPFPSFPRGHLLLPTGNNKYSDLSILKHQIKNQIFNESWHALEAKVDRQEVISSIKKKLIEEIPKYFESLKYDHLPPKSMSPAVREIYRAWTKVGGDKRVIDYTIMIAQEDDAYRFRIQDLFEYFNPNPWWKSMSFKSMRKDFDKAMKITEHCEVLGDMQERQRLWRRIFMLMLEDDELSARFLLFCNELNWGKVFLSEGDRYHFRGKYYRVDKRWFDY